MPSLRRAPAAFAGTGFRVLDLPLAEVARGLRPSPFHPAHVFRDEVGQSLHQYLVRLRLVAALDRLGAAHTDLSMMALDLGFSTHSHFSVAFRRAFGMSPSEARRWLAAAAYPELASGEAPPASLPHARVG